MNATTSQALRPLLAAAMVWAVGSPASVIGAGFERAARRDSPGRQHRDDGGDPEQDGTFGKPLKGLTPEQRRLFREGRDAFEEEEDAADGLGPIFNDVGCAACHFAPASGGSSEINETRAALFAGGVYQDLPGGSLFQSKAIEPGCLEKVPALANRKARRQTTPLFGLGLVEAIPDEQIEAYAAAQAAHNPEQAGRVHHVLDVASGLTRVGRLGWKAQQATLLAFSGDAYVNEMGITSPLFPSENAPNDDLVRLAACDAVADPEDDGDDLVRFADFMRFLAPPPRRAEGPRVEGGRRVFERVGCAVCHHAGFKAESPIGAIDGQSVDAFSDFLLHDAATGDGIVQGDAQSNELRTAPLWGLSASAPYLHDGSARTIVEAILRHGNQAAAARDAFLALSSADREKLLEFLDSI